MSIKHFVSFLFIVLFAACRSSPNSAPDTPDSNSVASYFVNSNGNDNNDGLSEKSPFRTLTHAIEVASKTDVKRITVIGKLTENVSTIDTVPILPLPGKHWSEPNPGEILITGKSNATAVEKAILTSNGGNALTIAPMVSIMLENIEIRDCFGHSAVLVFKGQLILAKGVKIRSNLSRNGGGIYVTNGGTLIIRADAEVSNNNATDSGGGIYFEGGSRGLLAENALVTNNKAKNGGGIALNESTFIMINNSEVKSNSAGNSGGGIYFHGELVLQDGAKITENTASKSGGGIYGASNDVSGTIDVNVKITGNRAPEFPDNNLGID